jgi:hypothetical protein
LCVWAGPLGSLLFLCSECSPHGCLIDATAMPLAAPTLATGRRVPQGAQAPCWPSAGQTPPPSWPLLFKPPALPQPGFPPPHDKAPLLISSTPRRASATPLDLGILVSAPAPKLARRGRCHLPMLPCRSKAPPPCRVAAR